MNIKAIWRGIRHFSPIIFSIATAAGIVVTPVLAVEGKSKADLIDPNSLEGAKPIDIVKAYAPAYGKAAIAGAASLLCLTASTAISWSRISHVTKAFAETKKIFAKYKSAVAATVGAAGTEAINKAFAEESAKDVPIPQSKNNLDGQEMFYDETYDYVFYATKADFLWASRVAFNKLRNDGYFTPWGFYEAMGVEPPPTCYGDYWRIGQDECIIECESDLVDITDPKEGSAVDANGTPYHYLEWYVLPHWPEDG